MPRDFLIRPIRNVPDELNKIIIAYRDDLESKGSLIYDPFRNTEQEGDPIGLRICTDNKNAIKNSKIIRIYNDPTSYGSMFDLGMTFMAEKPLLLVNPETLSETSEYMAEFLSDYSQNLSPQSKNQKRPSLIYSIQSAQRDEISKQNLVSFFWDGLSPEFLFKFGMAFMADKPIFLSNRQEIKRTSHKSFENVLLTLEDQRLKNS